MDAHARLGVRMGLWGGEAQPIETGERIVVSDEETILKGNQISQLGGRAVEMLATCLSPIQQVFIVLFEQRGWTQKPPRWTGLLGCRGETRVGILLLHSSLGELG